MLQCATLDGRRCANRAIGVLLEEVRRCLVFNRTLHSSHVLNERVLWIGSDSFSTHC
jgi:hypothetical protein